MKLYRQIIKDCFCSLKKISIISIILMLLLHTGYLLMPKYLAQLTQSILWWNNSVLYQTSILLWIIIVITVLVERAENILADYILARLEVIRTIYYRVKLLWLSYSQITSEWSGKIISKMNKWINAEIQIYRSIIRIIIVVWFRGVIILWIVLSQYPQAILPVSIIVLILAWFQYRASSKVDPITEAQSDVRELSSRNMVRQIQEWLLVRIHNKQQYEQQNDYTTYQHYASNETKIAAYNYSIYDILHLWFRLGEIVIMFYIGHMVMNGTVWYEKITEIVTYMWFFRWPLDVAINRFMIINKESSYYTKLYQFAHQTPEIFNWSLPYQYHNGTIQFTQVWFGYSDNPSDAIFDGLDLTISGGSKIALVGHSGSGKSTIIKLLLRLYDIQSGQIMIDGQDIKELDHLDEKLASFIHDSEKMIDKSDFKHIDRYDEKTNKLIDDLDDAKQLQFTRIKAGDAWVRNTTLYIGMMTELYTIVINVQKLVHYVRRMK